jgi:uncharacterized membrane protein
MTTSSTGMPSNIAMFVSYLFTWVSGIIILLIEKNDGEVRFHAAQSVILFGACSILGVLLPVIPLLGPLTLRIVGLIALAIWLVQLVTSLMGRPFKLPVISRFAAILVLKV